MRRSPIAYGSRGGVRGKPEEGLYLAAFSEEDPPSEGTSGEVVDLHVDPQEAEEFRERVSGERRLRVKLRGRKGGEALVEFWLIPLTETRTLELDREIVRALDQGLMVLGEGNRLLVANPKMAELLGCTEEELLQRGWEQAFPPEFLRRLRNHLERGRFTFEAVLGNIPVVVSGVPLQRGGESGAILVFMDVSPLKLKEQELASKVKELEDTKRAMLNLLEEMEATKRKLERLSITDELTGLFNRRHFYKMLAREMEVARKYGMPLSLLIMDLDDFKDYNDTHGHVEGDRALRRFAEVIERSIRKGVDSAYRLGGDEFAVIAPGSNREQAWKIGERIQGGLRDLSLSIGIAEFVEDMDTDSFISQADKRMYEEKRRRKKAPPH